MFECWFCGAFLEGVFQQLFLEIHFEDFLLALLRKPSLQIVRELLGSYVLSQGHSITIFELRLRGLENFLEKHAHQVILLISVQLQAQQNFELFSRTLPHFQTHFDSVLPVFLVDCFLGHVERDPSLSSSSVREYQETKQLPLYIHSVLTQDFLV